VEPIQGEGGIRATTTQFLKDLRAICDEFGLLLFYDEIHTGFGRTGKMWGYDWSGVKPDVAAIAKGMGGGFPIGAFMATEKAAVPQGAKRAGESAAMATPKYLLDHDKDHPKPLRQSLDHGKAMKKQRANGGHDKPLGGKTLAMIVEKPSTRTRVSFEVGMRELGGQTLMLGRTDTQLGRGETIADTAQVLSCYVDIIMMRTTVEEKLLEMAK